MNNSKIFPKYVIVSVESLAATVTLTIQFQQGLLGTWHSPGTEWKLQGLDPFFYNASGQKGAVKRLAMEEKPQGCCLVLSTKQGPHLGRERD